ncbi:uncharacterized protein LOC125037552 [Penaeus chinensis]|uniref:uncharacterized protein LOC125037552 n=1 Tax=Penaeus chinensis TaxID=139456 RepID=UPI001FB65CF4|nr:uncharacterized protein LOC125037552 [Penaeus chinensis]
MEVNLDPQWCGIKTHYYSTTLWNLNYPSTTRPLCTLPPPPLRSLRGPKHPRTPPKKPPQRSLQGPLTTTAAITTTATTFSTRMTSESFNTLQLGPLTRHDLKLLLTCEASNYNRTLPTSAVVMVDMNLPPLSVTITSPPPFLRAGQEYEVTCEVIGARPPPTVTWWQGARQVLHAALETSEDGNLTSSHLTLTPRPEDDGKVLKCVAESYVTNTVMHDSWTITVHYRPTATARFGSSLDVANIKEGDDVYFECDVYANPQASRVSWRLNNQVLNHNVSAGVIVSNHALVLQRVVRAWAGLYSCHALNPVGGGVSNTLRLDVKYAPVCSPGQVTTYAVGRYEDAEVTCSVDANPALTKFQWTFNNTADIIDVPQGRFSSDSTVSVITYTPMTSLDYGTLLCWAYNSIGTQRVPCVFHIVPAGKPDPPSNCSVGGAGGSRTSVRVVCSSEGGASTSFLLQARVVGGSHALNVSSPTPVFMVDGLRPGRKYDLFITAHNDKGASTPAHLTIAAHGSVYQHHDGPSEAEVRDGGKTAGGDEGAPGYPYLHTMSLPTLLPAALGVGAGLVIIIIILILLITFRTRRPRPRPEEAHLRSPSDHSLASDQKSLSGHRSPPPPAPQEGLRSPSTLTPGEAGGRACHDRDKQVETESDKEPDVIPLQEAYTAPALLPTTVLPPVCYHYPPLDAQPARMTSPRYGRLGVAGSGAPDHPRGPRDPLRDGPAPPRAPAAPLAPAPPAGQAASSPAGQPTQSPAVVLPPAGRAPPAPRHAPRPCVPPPRHPGPPPPALPGRRGPPPPARTGGREGGGPEAPVQHGVESVRVRGRRPQHAAAQEEGELRVRRRARARAP